MNNNHYYDEDFALEPQKGSSRDGLKDGELVRCILLDSSYPSAYKKAMAEQEKKDKEEAESLGLEFEAKPLLFKDGGIAFKVAVTKRLDSGEYTYTPEGGKFNPDPGFNCTTQISMVPPKLVYEKSWGSYTKGVLDVKQNGSLYINKILPDAFPAKNWNTNLPDAEKEAERISAWKDFLKMYDSFTEEQAKNWLYKSISQRYIFLRKLEEKGFSLVRPRVGLVFEAKVRRKEGSSFFDLDRFKWNAELRQWDIYGSPYAYIDDESVELAEQIVLEQTKQKAEQEHKELLKKQKEASLDEVPF